MANHGAAALILIASLLVAVAISGADARLPTLRHNAVVTLRHDANANGGYVLEEKFQQISCKTVVGVEPGQTCTTIAQGAGLNQVNFLAYNPNINCNSIFVGQWVCLYAQGA